MDDQSEGRLLTGRNDAAEFGNPETAERKSKRSLRWWAVKL